MKTLILPFYDVKYIVREFTLFIGSLAAFFKSQTIYTQSIKRSTVSYNIKPGPDPGLDIKKRKSKAHQ